MWIDVSNLKSLLQNWLYSVAVDARHRYVCMYLCNFIRTYYLKVLCFWRKASGSLFHFLSGFYFNFLNFKNIVSKRYNVLQKLSEKFDVSHYSAMCIWRKLMVELRCPEMSVICRVGKDHRFCNKVFLCTDLINSCMEWFKPKLVPLKCVLWSVVLFLEVCCLFRYKLLFNVLYEKSADPHGIYFSWRRIYFDIASAFVKTWKLWAGKVYKQVHYSRWNWECIVVLYNCDRVVELLLVLQFLKYPINIVYIKVSLVTLLKRWFKKNIVCSPYVILFSEFLKWNRMTFSKIKICVSLCDNRYICR